jgi:hypothetical protein
VELNVLPLAVGTDPVFRHSGSIIMSAVYSYDAERRDDKLIGMVKYALDTVLKELRPEIAAVFGAFPFRESYRYVHYSSIFLLSNLQFFASRRGCPVCASRELHL